MLPNPGLGAVYPRHPRTYRNSSTQLEADVKRVSLDSVVDDRYPLSMSEARDLATDQDMNAADLAWLEAALEEYKALLQYLREH